MTESKRVKYQSFVSDQPLDVIRANECESELSSLSTSRFRRLWNEIEDLRESNAGLVKALEAIGEYAENQADVSRDLEAADSIEFGEIANMARAALTAAGKGK